MVAVVVALSDSMVRLVAVLMIRAFPLPPSLPLSLSPSLHPLPLDTRSSSFRAEREDPEEDDEEERSKAGTSAVSFSSTTRPPSEYPEEEDEEEDEMWSKVSPFAPRSELGMVRSWYAAPRAFPICRLTVSLCFSCTFANSTASSVTR